PLPARTRGDRRDDRRSLGRLRRWWPSRARYCAPRAAGAGAAVCRLSTTFHLQSDMLKVPSNLSPRNLPARGRKPMVPPNAPSGRTVPLMFLTSESKVALPSTWLSLIVTATLAGLHCLVRSLALAGPFQSPSYGPAVASAIAVLTSRLACSWS